MIWGYHTYVYIYIERERLLQYEDGLRCGWKIIERNDGFPPAMMTPEGKQETSCVFWMFCFIQCRGSISTAPSPDAWHQPGMQPVVAWLDWKWDHSTSVGFLRAGSPSHHPQPIVKVAPPNRSPEIFGN